MMRIETSNPKLGPPSQMLSPPPRPTPRPGRRRRHPESQSCPVRGHRRMPTVVQRAVREKRREAMKGGRRRWRTRTTDLDLAAGPPRLPALPRRSPTEVSRPRSRSGARLPGDERFEHEQRQRQPAQPTPIDPGDEQAQPLLTMRNFKRAKQFALPAVSIGPGAERGSLGARPISIHDLRAPAAASIRKAMVGRMSVANKPASRCRPRSRSRKESSPDPP